MSLKRIVIFLLLAPALLGAKSFDSAGLSTQKKEKDQPVETISEAAKQRKADPKKRLTPNIDQAGDLKKIETQIKAINLIIKTESDNQKKIDLFIRRSQLYISAARTIGLKRTRLADMGPVEKKYLDSAKKTLEDLLKFSKDKPKRLGSIYYLLGMIEYEFERYDKVRDYFILSVKLDMKNPLATTMALMVGELDFDRDRFQEAIKSYQWLYKIMNPREKALADYKTAWSFIGLNDQESAKKYLIRVVRVNGEGSFVEDSLRDLAFLVAQKDDEQETIRFGTDNFADLAQRAKFYYHSLAYYLQRDKKKSRQPLFMEILAVEKDPYQRARILALKVSYERKEYPTVESFKAMAEMDNHIKKMDPALKEKFFFQEGGNLEDNSEAIIKNFVDAYTGRLNMPEKLTKDYIITALKKLIEIHLRLFPNSSKQDQIYSLWMDACFDTHDVACLQSLKPMFKAKGEKNKAFANLYALIGIKILTLVDQSYEKDPQAHEQELMTLINDFIKEHPDSPENSKLIRKSVAMMLKHEQYKEAIPLLEMLQKTDPSEDTLHKLLYCRFKLGMYEEIVHQPGIEKSKDPQIRDVYRESSLILAQKSLSGNNFEEYERNLKIFLASNPDEKKAALAYVDYLDRLLKAQKYDNFIREWRGMPIHMKESKDFVGIRSQALGSMMVDGYFADDPYLQKTTKDEALNFNILVYHRALNRPFTKDEFLAVRALPKDKRNYIYNLILVTKPKVMIDLLSSQKRLDDDERKILFTAYLLHRGHDQFTFNAEQIKLMKNVIPGKMIPVERSKLFAEFGKVRAPKLSLSANRYNQQVEDLMKHTRSMRKKFVREIGKLSLKERSEMLQKMIELEKSTSEAIKHSPTPAGLDDKQKAEYDAGISDVAKEFDNQAEEFTKSKAEIDVKNQVEEEDVAKQKLPQVSPEKLPAPDAASRFSTADELFQKAPIAALVFWDSQLSAKKISDETYYQGRVRLLLHIANNPSMREFIASELRQAQQEALLQKWKGLAE
jgi:tetratricopeptide (TPR) repeat protein